jgi:hypothetical protein
MTTAFASVAAVPPTFWRWPHFTPIEIACKGDGSLLIDDGFLDIIEALRVVCGFAFPINSWYRSPAYNLQVAKSGDDGAHTTGRAVDIQIYGERAWALLDAVFAQRRGGSSLCVTGVGVKQLGPMAGRYIHLDAIDGTDAHPRPRLWSY